MIKAHLTTKINEIRIYIGSRNYKEVNMMNIKKRVTNFFWLYCWH